MKTLKVVTVVVTYNAYRDGFFPRCLDEIKKVQLENELFLIDHSVVVVDSASSDNTPDNVRRNFPHIKMIASDKNLGYSGGNNRGFQEAQAMGADYIAVVTQDVYVEPDWLLRALKVADSDSKIGIVQPLLLLHPDRELINSTGNHIHFLGYGYAGDYRLPLNQYHNTNTVDIPYSSGAVLLLSAKAYADIGGFDEEMWMYNEDQDLGWRMNLQGYRNVLAPKSRAYHQYEFSRSITKMYYMDRNRLLVAFQNYHWLSLLLILPVLLVNEIATFLLSLKGGWHKEKLKVWGYFFKPNSWKTLWRKRRLRQNNRTVGDQKILKRFTGKIIFQDLDSPIIKYVANPILSLYWTIFQLILFW